MPWTVGSAVSTGDVLTATRYNNDVIAQGGGLVAYNQTTTAQTSVTTLTDLTSLSVTFTAAGGRYYLIHGFVTVLSSVSADNCGLAIANASNTTLALGHVISNTNAVAVHCNVFLRVSPSAGSVTYKLRGQRGAGTGTLTYTADALTPSFIMVTDVGAV